MSDVRVVDALAKGGLILTRHTKDTTPGAAAELLNYEVDIGGGFRRIDGYERFDGRIPPSSGWDGPWEWNLAGPGESPYGATWAAVAPVEGDPGDAVTLCIPLNGLTILGGLTMAAGFGLRVHDAPAQYTASVYASNHAFVTAIIAMTGVASATLSGDELCITTSIPAGGAAPRLEVVEWTVLDDSKTQEKLRSQIEKPQGFGPIYGIAVFKGTVICCRNFDSAGTDSRIYRSTPNGWEQIPSESRGGDAEYSFVAYNFYGDPEREGLYGADGKNKAFEIKGDPYPGVMEYTEIDTVVTVGETVYYPLLVAAQAMHLFMAFKGGWVQYSGIGNPFSDDVNDGAGGIAYSGEITNMVSLKDDAFAITTREDIFILYGKSDADWQSNTISSQGDGVGAIPKTVTAASGKTFFADRGGIFSIDSVLAYGNFSTSALSRPVNPLYQFFHPYTVGAVAARALGVYRVYYSGGNFISVTFGPGGMLGFGHGKLNISPKVLAYGVVEPTPLNYIPLASDEGAIATEPMATFPLGHGSASETTVEAVASNLALFEESVFIGAEDGMVYRMDKGNSFDGADMPYAIRFHFHDAGNMRLMKRWRKAVVEVRTQSQFPLLANVLFDYGSPKVHVHNGPVNEIEPAIGTWDVDDWGEFVWLGQYMSEGQIHINGQGRSVGLMLYGEGRVPAFVIEGYSLHFSPRRLVK